MNRKRVLVVDDNEHNREYARQVLACGWVISVAGDGVAGLESVASLRPDLVVLDLSMPRLDGWGVIAQLKRSNDTRGIPVVACSAHAMAGDRERVLAAGFDGYVAKPYRPEELVACVEGFLGPGEPDPDEEDEWSLEDCEWDAEEPGS